MPGWGGIGHKARIIHWVLYRVIHGTIYRVIQGHYTGYMVPPYSAWTTIQCMVQYAWTTIQCMEGCVSLDLTMIWGYDHCCGRTGVNILNYAGAGGGGGGGGDGAGAGTMAEFKKTASTASGS